MFVRVCQCVHCLNLGKQSEFESLSTALLYYLQARGLPEALVKLGGIYQHGGDGIRIDLGEALKYYQQAADMGDVTATMILGNIYHIGDGIKINLVQAIHYYEKAVDMGNVKALYLLGVIYARGDDQMAANLSKAMEFYKRAATIRSAVAWNIRAAALFELGCIYEYGGLDQGDDVRNAMQCYKQAFADRFGESVRKIMIQSCQQRAIKRDPNALYRLGWFHENGGSWSASFGRYIDINIDLSKAVGYYHRAAAKQSFPAVTRLADAVNRPDVFFLPLPFLPSRIAEAQ
jgi:TPR repeat protein